MIHSKLKEYYEQKINLRNMISRSQSKNNKVILTESQVNSLYPFPLMTKLKMVLDLIYSDAKVFRQVMKLALETWSHEELDHLAEFLVIFFCQPDQTFSEYLIVSRLKDIFEIEAKLKEKTKESFSLNENSFLMMIFNKIIESSECRNYARFVMKDIYDNINLDFLESIWFRTNDVKHYLQKRWNLKRRDHTFSLNSSDQFTSNTNIDEVEEWILSFAEDLEQIRSEGFQRSKSENIEPGLEPNNTRRRTRK